MRLHRRGRSIGHAAVLAAFGVWALFDGPPGRGVSASSTGREAGGQESTRLPGPPDPDAGGAPPDERVGVPVTGAPGVTVDVDTIMRRVREAGSTAPGIVLDQEEPRLRPFMPAEDPLAPAVSSWPTPAAGIESIQEPLAPQTPGTSFRAVATALGESVFVPPDSMGDVGPTQILVHTNGRIKVFDKTGAVGALNSGDTTFWAPVNAGQGTTDPEVRYDRLAGRWFVMTVNLAATNNLVLLAVSSGATITGSSSFTFYSFPIGTGASGENTNFCDYPGFGVDANAVYVGCNMFNASGLFQHTTGYVIRKSSVLSGGPIVVTPFVNLTGGATAGPFAPRGVDNDDPQATEGFFIGVDVALFSRLVLRRVGNPGGTPTLSANLNLTVPTTSTPLTQVASGSGTNIDTSDDRLFMASIHKNKITGTSTLWSAHNIAVTTACVGANTGTNRRNGSRWYEIGTLTGTPSLVQSGTLCDTASTNARGYIYPSVAETGQGHMALGSTTASATQFLGVATAGRLRTDPPGATQAPAFVQSGLASYTIVANGRNRWGDYSFTGVDPNDDMTVWTVQEYADSPLNNWAVRAVQLLAPPPATPSAVTPASVCAGLPATDIVVAGTSASGSGFFDPGPDPGGPGYANHIAASVTGGVIVTGMTFTDPTHVTLTIDTTSAVVGSGNVTITNPDGQSATGPGILTVTQPASPLASSNGPVCAGATLQLSASTIAGATYAWIGPNGFVSSAQNPTLLGVTTAAAGTYRVTATVGGCTSVAGTTTVGVIADGGSCNDANACTQTDTCQAGVCSGSNPVTCTALDQCHVAGTCDTQTGACSNPAQPDGTACDDANACTTGETCAGGVCSGGTPVTPAEVNDTVGLTDDGVTTTITWTDPPGDYNVYRGTISDGIPWSYDQVCLTSHLATPGATDTDLPAAGNAFFYLVTRVDACGESAPGRDSTGAPNPNPAPCP